MEKCIFWPTFPRKDTIKIEFLLIVELRESGNNVSGRSFDWYINRFKEIGIAPKSFEVELETVRHSLS